MGDDDSEYTDEYMMNGDIPRFKIFDASEDSYYDAVITGYFTNTEGTIVSGAWSDLGINMADNLNVDPDCAGILGGTAELDDCGVCNGSNANMDCAGECFGDHQGELFECFYPSNFSARETFFPNYFFYFLA